MGDLWRRAMPIFPCSLDTREVETKRAPGDQRGSRSDPRAGGVAMPTGPVEFGQLIADELNEWAKVARV
jgi:hypothetical protein